MVCSGRHHLKRVAMLWRGAAYVLKLIFEGFRSCGPNVTSTRLLQSALNGSLWKGQHGRDYLGKV